jgi:hypothetical protein
MKKSAATATTDESTVSPSNSTTYCTNSNRAVAQYVYETLKNSLGVSLSITITRQAKSEGSSATTVTIESSDGTQTQTFSDGWLTTLKEQPGGSPRRK